MRSKYDGSSVSILTSHQLLKPQRYSKSTHQEYSEHHLHKDGRVHSSGVFRPIHPFLFSRMAQMKGIHCGEKESTNYKGSQYTLFWVVKCLPHPKWTLERERQFKRHHLRQSLWPANLKQ